MKIGNHYFNFETTPYIMGILNVTPDSFSDGGKYNTIDKALYHVKEMIAEGASIIDIGGESTRPGHIQISVEEELSRVIPIIEKIKANFDIPLSLDTYRKEVLENALSYGIDMINDIWGLKYDRGLADLSKKYQLPICLMHNRSSDTYDDFSNDFINELTSIIQTALDLGVDKDKIIIDPGLGFQKSFQKDLFLTNHLYQLNAFNLPILYGSSRKRFIKNVVGEEISHRDIGTIATTIKAYQNGARLFRVHNVKANKLALDMILAIERTTYAGNDNTY